MCANLFYYLIKVAQRFFVNYFLDPRPLLMDPIVIALAWSFQLSICRFLEPFPSLDKVSIALL